MPLQSAILKGNTRLEAVAGGAPSVKKAPPYDDPDAVKRIQKALAALGYSMPKTFAGGEPDGKFGGETFNAVYAFQQKTFPGMFHEWDGRVGRKTIEKLDAALPKGAIPIPPNPPKPPAPQKVDVIVRFSGALNDVRTLTEDEVFNSMYFLEYQATAKILNRTLIRLGQLTNTVGAESTPLIAKYVNDIKERIKSNGEPGAIFVYGSSSGGRNAIDLAARLTQEGFKLELVAIMDAAFFPNSPELQNYPKNLFGEPEEIPFFKVAPIIAKSKANYYQHLGNHSENSVKHGRLFTSHMAGKEIHGRIDGFGNYGKDNEVEPLLPTRKDMSIFDNQAHIKLTEAATKVVIMDIRRALNTLS